MLLYKLSNLLNFIFSNKISGWLLSMIFILLFMVLVLSLFGINVRGLFSPSKNYYEPSDPQMHIIESGTNYDILIGQAEMEGKYSIAIRYLYNKLLLQLTNKGLIYWQKDKTNLDYLNEMSSSALSDDFRLITASFEYIWYGKFPCNQSRFFQIRNQFEQFYGQLNG
jgi:hypothetical protein